MHTLHTVTDWIVLYGQGKVCLMHYNNNVDAYCVKYGFLWLDALQIIKKIVLWEMIFYLIVTTFKRITLYCSKAITKCSIQS